tara:strand:- start:6243 stop:6575 length:333 start_codon:yes stop_codon:yes gene_type:complete
MTKNKSVDGSTLVQRLDQIKKYLQRYEKKLFNLMESLEDGDDLDHRAKTLEAVVTRFEKVAYKFFEVGCKLDEYRAREDQVGVLDTKAAREEILRRLDRIETSQGATELD